MLVHKIFWLTLVSIDFSFISINISSMFINNSLIIYINITSSIQSKVLPDKIWQVTIAKNWSNMGGVTADYSIKFGGLTPRGVGGGEVHCLSSQPLMLEIASYLRDEDCDPSISWKHLVQPLKPSEFVVETVMASYGLIKPVYQIVLTYEFQQKKSGEVCCEVPSV